MIRKFLFGASPLRFELNAKYAWSGVYFHETAEDLANTYNDPEVWVAPDLVSSNVKLKQPISKQIGSRTIDSWEYVVEPGIYECLVYDTPAKLYLWQEKGCKMMHGLICLTSDKEANDYAQKCYDRKAEYI
jgi:hypothetical protein